jgi:transcription elongation factor Elf1
VQQGKYTCPKCGSDSAKVKQMGSGYLVTCAKCGHSRITPRKSDKK